MGTSSPLHGRKTCTIRFHVEELFRAIGIIDTDPVIRRIPHDIGGGGSDFVFPKLALILLRGKLPRFKVTAYDR